jgi:hypothetical protein
MCSILDDKGTHTHTHKIYDEEKPNKTVARLGRYPSKSLVWLIQQRDVYVHHHHGMQRNCCICIHTITHETTVVHKLHNIHHEDNGVNLYIHGVYDRETDPTLALFSSEAWCHPSAYTNSQNYWSPSLTHQVSVHDIKGGVWCTECKWNYWAHFYYEATNLHWYVTHILTQFFE